MDTRHHHRFRALIKVMKFLKDKEQKLSEVPSIGILETALKQLVEDIIKADGVATGDISGATRGKAASRKSLINATMTVMRGMQSLAIATEDQKLSLDAGYSHSKLVHMTDSGLYIFCRKLHDIALTLAAPLANYQVTEEQIILILTLAHRLESALSGSAEMVLRKKVANKQVIERMGAAYALMGKKLDPMMDLFLDDEPDLVEHYRLARTIGHHSTASLPENRTGTVKASEPVSIGPLSYVATKGLLLVNASTEPMHFQLLYDEEPVGRSITVARMSAFMGLMADLADRGTALLLSTASKEPAQYRVEVG